ncbi:hypothetical protein O3G_MSEX010342 [Manduca sexta]|nr:hypothetical protein O3G_MSEX010342 [Manduca sexta]
MIRCRTGSDFCYTEQEMDTMLSDIEIIKQMGVDRFVFGALTDKQDIDEYNCKKVIEKAYPIPVTFHRAFDICNDPIIAINKIISLGFNRLLTSGQRPSASDDEAMKLIKSLLEYNKAIEIMPGAGVNINNAKSFIDMGCKIIHSSCKVIKYLPRIKNNLCMGTNESESIFISDENIVRKTKETISS